MTYQQAHKRLRRRLGDPSAYPCVNCRRPAQDWSLDSAVSSDRLLRETSGAYAGLAYTLTADDYSPRCRACHVRHDRRLGQPIANPSIARPSQPQATGEAHDRPA